MINVGYFRWFIRQAMAAAHHQNTMLVCRIFIVYFARGALSVIANWGLPSAWPFHDKRNSTKRSHAVSLYSESKISCHHRNRIIVAARNSALACFLIAKYIGISSHDVIVNHRRRALALRQAEQAMFASPDDTLILVPRLAGLMIKSALAISSRQEVAALDSMQTGALNTTSAFANRCRRNDIIESTIQWPIRFWARDAWR